MISLKKYLENNADGSPFHNEITDEDFVKNIRNIVLSLVHGYDIYFYAKDSVIETYEIDVDIKGSLYDLLLRSKSTLHLKTSGTTGPPKLISHSLKSLMKCTVDSKNDSLTTWGFAYSLRHISGVLLLLQAIRWESNVVDIRNLEADNLFCCLENNNVSHISAPATFYRLTCPLVRPAMSVLNIANGGEPFTAQLLEKVKASFPLSSIRNIYASTEFGSLLVSDSEYFEIPNRLEKRVKIKDGTLRVHKTLLSNSVLSTDEWFDTQDRVALDIDGRFRILGRSSEQVNVLGHLVSLRKVESAIEKLPHVTLAKVIAKPHSVFGHTLRTEIVLSKGISVSEIKEKLKLELRNYELPMSFKIVSQIELTRSGKIKR